MTVQEVIDELSKIEDKTKEVLYLNDDDNLLQFNNLEDANFYVMLVYKEGGKQ